MKIETESFIGSSVEAVSITNEIRIVQVKKYYMDRSLLNIYLIFKNCTYLSMVFVYAVSVVSDKAERPLAGTMEVIN